MTKKPFFKFFPDNWRADPKLRSCSLAARGLWMEMLCLMHEAEPYGYLRAADAAVVPKMLAKLVQADDRTVARLLTDLRQAGVYSVDETGTIFSRKMVRDHAKSLKGKEDGSKGGNPRLTQGLTTQDNPHIPESIFQSPESQKESKKDCAPASPGAPPVPGGEPAPEQQAQAHTPGGAAALDYYAFEAGVIRLTQKDLDTWEKAYPHISVGAELLDLANWKELNKGNWFFICQKALRKRNTAARKSLEEESEDEEVRSPIW